MTTIDQTKKIEMSSAEFIQNESSDPQKSKQQQMTSYSAFVVTWNVGSKFPDNISLRNLLGLNTSSDDHPLPDIYAIGLQEVNSQPQQQVLGLFKEDPWSQKTKDLLRTYDYVLIKTEQMQGLLLVIFILRKHVCHLRDMEAEFTRTGFGGIWGNKGAVSIRFSLYGCGLTFVAAHLAAHDHHLDERIEDYRQIIENHHYHVPRYREIYDHDYVFWFGDLNFRLQGDDTAAEITKIIKDDKMLPDLLKRDQLIYVREQMHKAFHFLHERLPGFPPTFKFKEGTSEYDLKRRPAWTDRILYGVQPNNRQPNMPLSMEQLSYKSHPGYMISDHKPVTAEFKFKLYSNFVAPCVTFRELTLWTIGDENTVEYIKPLIFEERDHDWIGIYRVGYASLTDYIAYEYVNQRESPPSSPDINTDPYFDAPPTHRQGHHHRNPRRMSRVVQDTIETVTIDFSDDIEMKDGESYMLIYFQNSGLRGVTSIAGMSNVFRAIKRSPSHRRVRAE